MGLVRGYKALAKGESDFNIIGRWRTWGIVSLALVVVSLGGLLLRDLNLSLAFEGGSAFSAPISEGKDPTVPEISAAMTDAGLTNPEVQIARSADGSRIIRVEAKTVGVLEPVVDKLAGISGAERDAISVQEVGPTWGSQISSKALRALIVFLILVVIYISIRFEPKVALASIVALIHDLIFAVGIYALVGFEVSPATVVAYLTIMGYSLYDSVVVFDKVRENQVLVTGTSRMTYSDMVNKSVNQTLMRSINTSLSSLLPVGALLFVGVYLFGADTLKDLALALFLGIAVGSYSSVFVGPPLLALLKEREPRYKQLRARASRGMTPAAATAGPASSGGATGPAPDDEDDTEPPAPRSTRAQPGPGRQTTVAPRGRKKSRKKRRR
ncbi:MAG TPA: protein translocase subunit SecF [Actinomycetota bacterium]|nr:protein translocase subunit SecF [Actinomycetota bacterium]